MPTRVKGFKPYAVQRDSAVAGIGTFDARASMSALLSTTDLGVPRAGVIPSGTFYNADGTIPASGLLLARSPNAMAVNFNRVRFVIPASDGTAYVGGVTADGTLDIGAAHASTTRIDLYVGRIYDDQNALGSERESYVEMIQGTPGQGAPAVPAGAAEVGRVTVTPGATAITPAMISFPNLRYTVGVGGIRPVLSPAGAAQGDYPGGYRDYGGNLERYMGKDPAGNDLGWLTMATSAWTPWTPPLKSIVRNLSLGNGGSVNGEYRVAARECRFRLEYNFGSSGVDGGAGNVFVDLPVTPARAGRGLGQCWLVSPGGIFGGFCALLPEDGRIYFLFPGADSQSSNKFARLQNADSNGSVNCNPKQPSGSFAIDKGGRLVAQGEYALA